MARGFSLIELIVVFAIIGLLLAIAIPGLLKFNKGQALKATAAELKANLRYAQDAAISGKKNKPLEGLDVCTEDEDTLLGYYVTFELGMTSYSLGEKCGVPTNLKNFAVRNYDFPSGAGISVSELVPKLRGSEVTVSGMITVLFQPVSKGIVFKNGDASGTLDSFSLNIDSLEIVLSNGESSYSVTVNKGGEIYETKK